jgi:hypothetical protein
MGGKQFSLLGIIITLLQAEWSEKDPGNDPEAMGSR